MCASSNCRSVRTSTISAPAARCCSTWRGDSGSSSTPLGEQRAGVEVDDRLEVRRLRAELRERLLDELVLVGDPQHRVGVAFVADRRADLHVHAGAAAHRAAEMPGPDLAAVGQRQQLLVQRAEDAARALGLLDREVRPRDVADEQRVAGQHGPRLGAAGGVDQRERRVLGPMSGRVQRADAHAAELELPAVLERLVVVLGRGLAVHMDRGAGGGRQAAVAGDVIGVVVGLEDVLDLHAHVARQLEVLVDLKARVDDRRDAGVLVADEVGGAAEVVVGELAEDHELQASRVGPPGAPGGRRVAAMPLSMPRQYSSGRP